MQPPTDRRREAPGAASRGAGGRAGERTRQQPPAAEQGRLFFMPAPAPPGRQHRPPPAAAVDRDRPFFMPPPAPPGRSRSNQPPPAADPPSASTTRPAPPPPPAPSPPPPPPAHSYDNYDPTTALSPGLRRPPNQTPLPPPHRLPRPSSSPCSSALSSCLVATAFLLLSAGGAGAALFLLFRPRPPDISVAAVRLPSFSASNGTVAFTFEQTAAVRNPNRSPLAHFDSSLRVAYAGGELGAAVYIPAGLIGGGSTKHVSAVFDVPAIPVAVQPTTMVAGAGADAASAAQQQQSQAPPVIEVHSLLVVKGRVNVLRVLTHRVQAAKLCRVGVSPLDGTVLGFRC